MTEPYLADPDRRITRDEAAARADKGAGALKALGLKPDDTLAVLMRNDLAQMEVMAAAKLAGVVLVALNWHGAAQEVGAILDDAGASVVIAHRDMIDAVAPAMEGRTVIGVTPGPTLAGAYDADANARPDLPEWEDLLTAADPISAPEAPRPILRYTSGSTGKPKGIRRIEAEDADPAELAYRVGVELMRFRPGMRYYTAAPLYHSAPSSLTGIAMALPETSVFVSPRFDAETMLADIAREKITHIYLVPTMMSRMLKLPEEVKAKYDTSSVEFCVSTGSPWPHDLKAAMIDWWGPVFWETYGASEIGYMTMVSSEEALARPGTAGRAALDASIRIYGEDGALLPPGEVGIIHVRMESFGDFDYSNDPASRVSAEIDGHISVGDMGWLDEEGYLFITDRKKDMIISGGANIFPAEIEAVLMQADFIRDCAVFGAPDPEFGEKIVAAVEPAAGWTPDEAELRDWLKGRLAGMKHPRIIDFHDALPREDTGKIFKPRLRAPYWEGAGRKI